LLRHRGVTVRKTIDVIIATFCVRNGHVLLHADRDFAPMAEHLGLRTL
jgi:predicted nucleic acid-binding protein